MEKKVIMKKYIVSFIQTNERQIEVEANDKSEAIDKALEELETHSFKKNMELSQQGYFETGDVDEVEE